MKRRSIVAVATGLALAASPALVAGAGGASAAAFTPGAPGVGDPYFPLDGNGGYDVAHYLLALRYTPDNDRLAGRATITAKATQDLSRFNLDFQGMTVHSITVDGRPATWAREGQELMITPAQGIPSGTTYRTVVTYSGVPETIGDPQLGGLSGFIHTDDGAVVAGQPDSAATWFPVNDHPIDKAAYTFAIQVPQGLEAVANGALLGRRTAGGMTTWGWNATEPMASYLTVLSIGEFDIDAYAAEGIRYWDALDPDLSAKPDPHSGDRYLISDIASEGPSYKRLTRTVSVPAAGGALSFWVERDTEFAWDFFGVEARPVGTDDWTMLPDETGHATQETLAACFGVLADHPSLDRYLTAEDEGCQPSGTTGQWWAASGGSDGWERWEVDLSAYAGSDVEVSLSYVSDVIIQGGGVYVDDVETPTGAGSTSFENDGDPLDGWTVAGPPAGSPDNPNDWFVGTAADAPTPPLGANARASFARQPEIIRFLSNLVGPYPFSVGGGIVDDVDGLGFALETQTRPIYSKGFFSTPQSGDAVVVHELAHQWFGDSLALARWQDIWLNEGFATYAEWMWSEREGLGTAGEIFEEQASRPADDPFWDVRIGDPGPDDLFHIAVYDRGAMTLHALRRKIGNATFQDLVQTWVEEQSGGHVTTPEFIATAERVSGQELDAFFQTWLYTGEKPAGLPAGSPGAAAATLAGVAGSGHHHHHGHHHGPERLPRP